MTVDEALKIIAQERLDAMSEGMSAEECSQMAVYVLHDAVLKDRREMLTLRERHISAKDEIFRLAELLQKYDPTWGSPMHLNAAQGQRAAAIQRGEDAQQEPGVNQGVFGGVLAVGNPCPGRWIGPPDASLRQWDCPCGAAQPRYCKTETCPESRCEHGARKNVYCEYCRG